MMLTKQRCFCDCCLACISMITEYSYDQVWDRMTEHERLHMNLGQGLIPYTEIRLLKVLTEEEYVYFDRENVNDFPRLLKHPAIITVPSNYFMGKHHTVCHFPGYGVIDPGNHNRYTQIPDDWFYIAISLERCRDIVTLPEDFIWSEYHSQMDYPQLLDGTEW